MKESSWQRMNGPRDDIEEDEIQFMSFEETKEVYRDDEYEYRALFPDVADWSQVPMTILTHPIHETQTDLS